MNSIKSALLTGRRADIQLREREVRDGLFTFVPAVPSAQTRHGNRCRTGSGRRRGDGVRSPDHCAGDDWAVIPSLRAPSQLGDQQRADARKLLGVPKDAFLLCSFGILAPTKLNDRLLRAFLASELAQDLALAVTADLT